MDVEEIPGKMSFPVLSKFDTQKLEKKLGEGKCSSLAASVARLYVVIDKQWKYTGIVGVIAFVLDRESKAQFIRIYDYSSLELRFQVEVAFCPSYVQESEYFHTMEVENGVTLGFLFAVSREEGVQDEKNKTLTSEAKRFHSKVTSLSYKEDELKSARESSKQVIATSDPPSKRRGSAWGIGGVMNTLKGKIGLSSGTAAVGVVGAPFEFQHLAHIGLHADGTMDVKNIPENWKPYLKQAKVRKEDFQNPEAVRIILGTLNSLVPASGPNNPKAKTTDEPKTKAEFKPEPRADSKGDDSSCKDSPNIRRHAKSVKARYNYLANSEKEVSIAAGEILSSLRTFPDGWSKVAKPNGQVGMVPTEYLEDVEAALPSAALPLATRATPPPPVRAQESANTSASTNTSSNSSVKTMPNASPVAVRAPPPRPASL